MMNGTSKLTKLLGDENPLVKRLMDNIEETNIYAETYEKYKNLEAYLDENGIIRNKRN